MNPDRWLEFSVREIRVIDDALRIYLGEIAGNCRDAVDAEKLRMELKATQTTKAAQV